MPLESILDCIKHRRLSDYFFKAITAAFPAPSPLSIAKASPGVVPHSFRGWARRCQTPHNPLSTQNRPSTRRVFPNIWPSSLERWQTIQPAKTKPASRGSLRVKLGLFPTSGLLSKESSQATQAKRRPFSCHCPDSSCTQSESRHLCLSPVVGSAS